MTSKELEEEIFKKSVEAVNELGKKGRLRKKKQKEITSFTRRLIKREKATKGGRK